MPYSILRTQSKNQQDQELFHLLVSVQPKELTVTLSKLSCILIWICVKYCKVLIYFLDLFILMF